MTIKMYHPKHTGFGIFHEEFALTTVFVTDDEGRVHVNPEIIEADEDCVVIEYWGEEVMGTAVTMATMTHEEALTIAKRNHYRVVINRQTFEWYEGNRRQMAQWCAGFVKRRGSRMHLIPISMNDSLALIERTKKIVYWTNSRRCEIVAA